MCLIILTPPTFYGAEVLKICVRRKTSINQSITFYSIYIVLHIGRHACEIKIKAFYHDM